MVFDSKGVRRKVFQNVRDSGLIGGVGIPLIAQNGGIGTRSSRWGAGWHMDMEKPSALGSVAFPRRIFVGCESAGVLRLRGGFTS